MAQFSNYYNNYRYYNKITTIFCIWDCMPQLPHCSLFLPNSLNEETPTGKLTKSSYLIPSNFSISLLISAEACVASPSGTSVLEDFGSAGKGLDGAGGIFSCPAGWRWTGFGGTKNPKSKVESFSSFKLIKNKSRVLLEKLERLFFFDSWNHVTLGYLQIQAHWF